MACIRLGSACCRCYLPPSGLSLSVDIDEQRWRLGEISARSGRGLGVAVEDQT